MEQIPISEVVPAERVQCAQVDDTKALSRSDMHENTQISLSTNAPRDASTITNFESSSRPNADTSQPLSTVCMEPEKDGALTQDDIGSSAPQENAAEFAKNSGAVEVGTPAAASFNHANTYSTALSVAEETSITAPPHEILFKPAEGTHKCIPSSPFTLLPETEELHDNTSSPQTPSDRTDGTHIPSLHDHSSPDYPINNILATVSNPCIKLQSESATNRADEVHISATCSILSMQTSTDMYDSSSTLDTTPPSPSLTVMSENLHALPQIADFQTPVIADCHDAIFLPAAGNAFDFCSALTGAIKSDQDMPCSAALDIRNHGSPTLLHPLENFARLLPHVASNSQNHSSAEPQISATDQSSSDNHAIDDKQGPAVPATGIDNLEPFSSKIPQHHSPPHYDSFASPNTHFSSVALSNTLDNDGTFTVVKDSISTDQELPTEVEDDDTDVDENEPSDPTITPDIIDEKGEKQEDEDMEEDELDELSFSHVLPSLSCLPAAAPPSSSPPLQALKEALEDEEDALSSSPPFPLFSSSPVQQIFSSSPVDLMPSSQPSSVIDIDGDCEKVPVALDEPVEVVVNEQHDVDRVLSHSSDASSCKAMEFTDTVQGSEGDEDQRKRKHDGDFNATSTEVAVFSLPALHATNSSHKETQSNSGEASPPSKRQKPSDLTRVPTTRRMTLTSVKTQYKKLAAPFRSPVIDRLKAASADAVAGVGGAFYVKATTNSSGNDDPQEKIVSAELVEETNKEKKDGKIAHRTTRASLQFKSPLVSPSSSSFVSPVNDLASATTPVQGRVATGPVRLTPTVQALEKRVQTLKRAITVKQGSEEEELAQLVKKWTEAGREVAWSVWEVVKDRTCQDSSGGGNAKGGGDSWGWGEKKTAFAGSWGWGDEGRSREGEEGSERKSSNEDEEEEEVKRDTMGTMLRQLGIDPDTLGWDEQQECFVDEDSS